MQLFELVSPRLVPPAGGAEPGVLCRTAASALGGMPSYGGLQHLPGRGRLSRAEDYFAALAKPLALDADGAGDEDEQPTRDPHTLAVGFLLRLRRTGWLEEHPRQL